MATNNDEMNKYDGAAEATILGGVGVYGAKKLRDYSKKDTSVDDKLRKSASKWKTSPDDMLAARAYVSIVKAELKALQDGDGTKAAISKAKREVRAAEKKISTIQERQEVKKLFDDNPDRSATRIQDDYKTEKARIAGDKEYFKTKEGKSVKSRQDARAAKLKDTPKATARKIGLPVKRMKGLIGSAIGSGVGYLGSQGLRDYYDETAGDIRRRSDEQKGEVTKSAERKAQEYDDVAGYWDNMNEYAGYGTGVAAAGLAGTQAANRINAMYNIGRYGPDADVGGMTNIESLKQFGKDIGGAVKAPFKRAGAVSKRFNPLDGVDAQRAKDIYDYDVEQLAEAKKKRFTDPKMEQIEKYNEALEKRLTVEEAEKARFEGADRPEESGIKRTINNQMDKRIDQLKRSVRTARDNLNKSKATGSSTVVDLTKNKDRLKELEGKLGSIIEDKNWLKQELDFELESDSKLIKKYAKYIGSEAAATGKWSTADRGAFKANSGVIAAEDMATKVKGAAEDVIDTGTEKSKGFIESAKQKATDAYKRAVGRPVAPEAGLSQVPETGAVAEPKKPAGKITKAAKAGGAIATGVAPGGALNFALKTKRDLEEQGVSPIVQQLMDSGASEAEINEAIREDMYATAFRNTGIPEMADQITDWLDKDMSGYDRAGDILSTGGDVVTGMAQGVYDSAMGLGDLYSRTKDWATGEGEFGALYNPDGTKRTIMGYDTPEGMYSPGAAFSGNVYGDGTTPPTEPKTSGVTSPGVEGEDALNKRKQAEIYNKQQATTREAAVQEAIAKKKYGGYTSERDYADAYGVKTAADHFGVTDSGRYGGTPIYVSEDGTSFSDVPTNVMDPSKYDKVAGKAANQARQQYVKFEKAAKEQAKQKARGAAFAGVSDEDYNAMTPADRAKAYTDFNRAKLNSAKGKDLYDRDLQRRIGLAKGDPGYMEHTTQQLLKGQPTQAEMADVKYALNKQRIDDSLKWNPFAKAADPYAVHPREDLSGYWGDAVEEPMEPLAKGYTKLAPYTPK